MTSNNLYKEQLLMLNKDFNSSREWMAEITPFIKFLSMMDYAHIFDLHNVFLLTNYINNGFKGNYNQSTLAILGDALIYTAIAEIYVGRFQTLNAEFTYVRKILTSNELMAKLYDDMMPSSLHVNGTIRPDVSEHMKGTYIEAFVGYAHLRGCKEFTIVMTKLLILKKLGLINRNSFLEATDLKTFSDENPLIGCSALNVTKDSSANYIKIDLSDETLRQILNMSIDSEMNLNAEAGVAKKRLSILQKRMLNQGEMELAEQGISEHQIVKAIILRTNSESIELLTLKDILTQKFGYEVSKTLINSCLFSLEAKSFVKRVDKTKWCTNYKEKIDVHYL